MFKPISCRHRPALPARQAPQRFISFISLASILGIAIGVAALITTLAVMSGFQREIRDRMLQMAAHATDQRRRRRSWRTGAQAVTEACRDPRVPAPRPMSRRRRCCTGRDASRRIIRGVMPAEEGKVSVLGAEDGRTASSTELTPGSFNIVLGQELAMWLGVGVGDSVIVTHRLPGHADRRDAAAQALHRSAASSRPATRNTTRAWPSSNMQDAQRLLRMGDGATGVRLRLHDMDQAFAVARDLALRLPGRTASATGCSDNANMFRALAMEKTMMAILLSLIVAVGAFNLVSIAGHAGHRQAGRHRDPAHARA